MNYQKKLNDALDAVKREGRYRVFADLRRHRGAFPAADFVQSNASRPITVWCSNDYLGMGQHPDVIAARAEQQRREARAPKTPRGNPALRPAPPQSGKPVWSNRHSS